MNQVIESCADSVLSGTQLNRRQGLALAAAAKEDFEDMLYWADRIRRHFFGDSVRLCSIVPGRLGGCGQDCAFCAQSLHYNTSVDKTPRLLSDEKILSAAAEARSSGVSSFGIVYSGRSPVAAEFEHLLGLVEQIRRNIGIPVCAALGILEEAQMRQLASAGAVRYNHNLETSRRYFPNIVKTHHYQERVKTIQAALKAGLRVCGGGIFGLGETDEDRVELALELRTLGVDTVPMNFLHPIPGTPLGSSPPLPPKEILRIIALYRFLLPEADLKVAGGRVFNLRDMQSWIFRAGCSSIISGNYLATAGRSVPEDKQMLADLGLRIAD
ncbi:MAG TPA: biotin synthase BioB [Anaerohalosphaeraceae bacterium]|nr:biotin synthase BioB [Anaerohalosphaeraceae bacterium]